MRKRNSNEGFTLIEMVIAATMMAMALAVFATALTMSGKAVQAGKNQIVAVNYAREELETVRTKAFGDPMLAVGTTTFTNKPYKGQRVVSLITTNIKSVAITVVWTNNVVGGAYTARLTSAYCSALH